jgi:hypothetical protein
MANTFIKIATVTVTSATQATLEFTSIPQTYTDLFITLSARADTAAIDVVGLTVNGGGTTVGTNRYVDGSGSAFRSGAVNNYQGLKQPSSYTANIFSNIEMYIPNYISGLNKFISSNNTTENNATEAYMGYSGSLWANTSAITSLTLSNGGGGNFVQYSTATLYGIKSS